MTATTQPRQGLDVTPTWTALLPYFFAVLEDGTAEGKRIARDELRRMAQAADNWNTHANEEPAA